MTYPLFDLRSMTDAVNEKKPIGGFFLNTFFSNTKNHTTQIVDIDVYKGDRRTAVYTKVSDKSTPFDRIKGSTSAFEAPTIKLSRSIQPIDALLRQSGETIYSPKTPNQRAAEMLAKDLDDLDEAISRSEELQAAQAIITGKVIIQGSDIDAEVSMNRDATLVDQPTSILPSTGAGWANANTDISKDIRFMRQRVFKASGFTPNIMVLGSTALEAFMANNTVKTLLDNRRLTPGELDFSKEVKLENGIFYGMFQGMQIWEYAELYKDPITGVEANIMPAEKVVFAASNARCTRHYGAIIDQDAMDIGITAVAARRFSKSWVEKDPSLRKVLLQASPVMVTENTDAFATVDVIV